MIKTIVSISIISSLLLFIAEYSDIFIFLLQLKGTFIYYFAMLFSSLTIFSIFAVIMYEIVVGILKKL